MSDLRAVGTLANVRSFIPDLVNARGNFVPCTARNLLIPLAEKL